MKDSNRIRLIHWNQQEAQEKITCIQSAGYTVEFDVFDNKLLREIKEDPPDLIVIDLSRLPSQGRDVAMALRTFKSTRYVPLVFLDGTEEKIKRVQESLPDAVYTTMDQIKETLKKAIAHPPVNPIVPKSLLDGYSQTPLPKKLGIKTKTRVGLVNAPQDFSRTLGELPEGATLKKFSQGTSDLIIWFTRSLQELEGQIEEMGKKVGQDGIWIAWPKKASGIASDLNQAIVRKIGLASGLVDYKICAIDDTWSALRFARRKSK